MSRQGGYGKAVNSLREEYTPSLQCLLHTGDQHLVAVKDILQFCVAVLDAVAIELQKPGSFKGRFWSGGARLGR